MRKKKSPSSKCSAGSEGSDSALRRQVIRYPKDGYFAIVNPKGLCPSIQSANKCFDKNTLLDVSGPTTTTNMPAKFTEKGSDIKSLLKGILGILTPILFPILNYLPLDSHAKLSQSLENVKDSKIQGELFSLKSAEYLKLRNPDGFYLRTLKGFLAMIKDTRSKSSYPRWMNWGLMCNGKCLTLKLSYPKIVSGSLSSVLEEKPDEKYHLSEKTLKKILEKKDAHPDIRWKSGIKGEGRVPFPDDTNKPSRTITSAEGGANRMTHGIIILADILEEKVDEKYYLSEKMLSFLLNRLKINQGKRGRAHISNGNDISKSLDMGKIRDSSKTFFKDRKIRRLTPKECERLQGFPDDWTKECSDVQRYKQMGNAVSVPVIEVIGKAILKTINWNQNFIQQNANNVNANFT